MMTCVICKQAEPVAGNTVTFNRDGAVIVFKHVPTRECPNCGEAYVDAKAGAQLLKQAEQAAQNGAEVEVRHYCSA